MCAACWDMTENSEKNKTLTYNQASLSELGVEFGLELNNSYNRASDLSKFIMKGHSKIYRPNTWVQFFLPNHPSAFFCYLLSG